MRELRDEKRATVKNLSAQGLWIRVECCFLLSNDSKTMKVCRKTNKNDTPQYFAPKFVTCNINHVLGHPLGLEVLSKLAKDESMT